MRAMPLHPRRAGLVLLGSVVGTCLGIVAFLGLRACARLVAERVQTGAPFDTLSPAERAGILRLRRLPPQVDR